ncbi:hypothetical protein A5781_09935 [Mycobacterium sp. 852002-30065_SCH5024008]|nr:hypothetical protein A5781_09935 [Mycobacterium sp. 852002-30065_SCH5024008]
MRSSAASDVYKRQAQPAQPWWPSALGYGVLGVVVGLTAWALNRKRSDDDVGEPATTSRSSGS